MKHLPALLLLLAFAASCRETVPTESPAPAGKPVEKGETPGSDRDFVGLTEAEGEALAKERKLAYRVVMVDGEHRPATRDYRPDRVNFELEKGRIVRTTRG